jgi:hypothetical protein
MDDLLNLPDTPKPKLTRGESLERARAARADKRAAGEVEPKAVPVKASGSPELDFWGLALLTTMQNFQAKSAQGVDACLLAADRALEHWKKKREVLK